MLKLKERQKFYDLIRPFRAEKRLSVGQSASSKASFSGCGFARAEPQSELGATYLSSRLSFCISDVQELPFNFGWTSVLLCDSLESFINFVFRQGPETWVDSFLAVGPWPTNDTNL